jgi:hypothetical protein
MSTTYVPDWRVISNAVVEAAEVLKGLPETAVSSDLVSMLATNLGVTSTVATPLVEVICFERTRNVSGSNMDLAKRFRAWFDLSLTLTARIIREVERIEALIDKGNALREGRYWTISFALFVGKRAEIRVENSDTKTFESMEWQNEVTHRGAIMTGGSTFIGKRSEAVAKAASTLAVDHYEIEVG